MGDNAEMILDGTLDSITGEYLGEGDGYPRSRFHTQKHKGEGSVRTSTRNVMEYFKDLTFQELQGGGLNVKIPGNGTVTVWWSKRKWTHSKKPNQWYYFRNQPREHANELIAQIEGLLGIHHPNQPIVVKAEPVAKTVTVNTTQQCIDHLLKKAARVEEVTPKENKLINMLRTVADELKQYL